MVRFTVRVMALSAERLIHIPEVTGKTMRVVVFDKGCCVVGIVVELVAEIAPGATLIIEVWSMFEQGGSPLQCLGITRTPVHC